MLVKACGQDIVAEDSMAGHCESAGKGAFPRAPDTGKHDQTVAQLHARSVQANERVIGVGQRIGKRRDHVAERVHRIQFVRRLIAKAGLAKKAVAVRNRSYGEKGAEGRVGLSNVERPTRHDHWDELQNVIRVVDTKWRLDACEADVMRH